MPAYKEFNQQWPRCIFMWSNVATSTLLLQTMAVANIQVTLYSIYLVFVLKNIAVANVQVTFFSISWLYFYLWQNALTTLYFTSILYTFLLYTFKSWGVSFDSKFELCCFFSGTAGLFSVLMLLLLRIWVVSNEKHIKKLDLTWTIVRTRNGSRKMKIWSKN